MPPRPRLDVYVLNNGEDEHDIFYALPVGLGMPRQFARGVVTAERHEIHLHSDVHRSHGYRHALLVADEARGVDDDLRLAAVHARREGVDRFLVLVLPSLRDGRGRLDEVERRVRALLHDLGVDGDATPVLRGPPTRSAGRDEGRTQAAMRELLAALDDLPAVTPAPTLTGLSAEFAIEADMLDLVFPLLLPATLIDDVRATPADTRALRGGGGGSFEGGEPYLDQDEAWPHCPDCGRVMAGRLQIDSRDALHPVPAGHGLFVVFTCPESSCEGEVLRHHPSPDPQRRRHGEAEGRDYFTARPTIFRPSGRCWLLPEPEVFVDEHPDTAARLGEVAYNDDAAAVFHRIAQAIGVSGLIVCQHLGGHHLTTVGTVTPRCELCESPCVLLAQTDYADDQRCLWACPRHPERMVHRIVP
ncbi:hypothetical protein [Nannocystis radixulma]|uniref:REase associating with pPIWI RE domain-containing protein n=1 Tax=Nannocystis radixulma TaxID=2995305 RepID=A0ABT5BMA9_9BACT|nr:hypothetical protein [Nannocystis radixulma]MDC0675302.1 hypothetical protein [Nannocystis radixulma]